jgi:hypothetical protein
VPVVLKEKPVITEAKFVLKLRPMKPALDGIVIPFPEKRAAVAQFGQSSGIAVEKSTGIDAQAENRPKGFALPN